MAEGLEAVLRQEGPIPLDAELTCAPGEVLALVGPSGSGKSTVLRALAGLYTPRHGRIVCAGELWFDSRTGVRLPPARRRIGMVFQSYALFPHLTALENVLEAMDDPSGPKARRQAREWLAKVHLDGLEDRRPHQLSGGQQQRVALARALARQPRLLLLDEPFSAVDRATRERLYAELAGLRRELVMPVLLVTHDLDEAVSLADRMTLLSRGRTLQSGAPLEVMQHPASREAARILGLENCFPGRVLAHQGEAGFTVIEWARRELKVRLQTAFPVGSEVLWVVPPAGVLLMPSHGDAAGELDHVLTGTVLSVLGLSDRLKLRVGVEGEPAAVFDMVVPRHLGERHRLTPGRSLPLRLRGTHIHLMPAASAKDPG